MNRVNVVHKPYKSDLEHQWKCGRYDMLTASRASDFLKDTIIKRVTSRRKPGRRFFGEAYVAATEDYALGFYGSFKWLTNPWFLEQDTPARGRYADFEETLRTQLQGQLRVPGLRRLQRAAEAVRATLGVTPEPPDLWLIDHRSRHRFIEVKLPGDTLSAGQVAGLALLASRLRVKGKVSVEVVCLYSE